MLIELTSPSRFIIRGEEARQWRIANKREVPNAKHIKRRKRRMKNWDGCKYPGRMQRGVLELRRGMLENVARAFPDSTIRPLFDTSRVPKAGFHFDEPGKWQGEDQEPWDKLRDYQRDAISLGLKRKWGQVAMATNAGKGAIIALLAKAVVNGGGRVLVLCDEISVFDALEEQIFEWSGIVPGTLQAGEFDTVDDPVVLAMVPTLIGRAFPVCPDKDQPWHTGRKSCGQCKDGRGWDKRWIEWLHEFNMVLVDEADKATAATWQAVLGECENSTWRLGFSGTFPDHATLDGMILEETIGPTLTKVKNIELVERGISAKPVVELYPYRHTVWEPDEWLKLEGRERRQLIYEQQIVYNQARHDYVMSLIDESVPHAIIVNRVDHGRELERVIPNSRFLSGSATKPERNKVLSEFRAGHFRVLIATKILDRGTNLLGHTVGLIFASGEGSARQTLQRIGRGLRREDGKEFIFIKDIIDTGHKYLANSARKRVDIYNEEGFDIRIIDRA